MIILKEDMDMLKSEDEKLKYLLKVSDSIDDILSHKWEVIKSTENELCLKCSVCSCVYGVVIYNSGLKARLFLPSEHSRDSVPIMSCDAAIMNKALE